MRNASCVTQVHKKKLSIIWMPPFWKESEAPPSRSYNISGYVCNMIFSTSASFNNNDTCTRKPRSNFIRATTMRPTRKSERTEAFFEIKNSGNGRFWRRARREDEMKQKEKSAGNKKSEGGISGAGERESMRSRWYVRMGKSSWRPSGPSAAFLQHLQALHTNTMPWTSRRQPFKCCDVQIFNKSPCKFRNRSTRSKIL